MIDAMLKNADVWGKADVEKKQSTSLSHKSPHRQFPFNINAMVGLRLANRSVTGVP